MYTTATEIVEQRFRHCFAPERSHRLILLVRSHFRPQSHLSPLAGGALGTGKRWLWIRMI